MGEMGGARMGNRRSSGGQYGGDGGSVGDSPRGPLKQRGNPHLNPGTETR
jgi:hypothetical protein